MENRSDLIGIEERHGSGVYQKRPLVIMRGQGARVYDAEGREYLDMTSGQGVALLGHSHPAVVRALEDQAPRLISCPEIFYNDRRASLYEALAKHMPEGLERFFLCNSGAEAVEGAIKLARLMTGRPGVVAMRRGFHGRTFAALSATWKASYRQPFEPLVPGFQHIAFNDLQAAAKAIDHRIGAVVLEVIQGEGGVHIARGDYLRQLRGLCSERGALLVFDEIQTGLGRTGYWLACQHEEVIPDVICLGKGLAGGLPMGAVAWQGALGALPRGSHGSTFGGGPLACAAAEATLNVLEEEALPARAARLGERFLQNLGEINHPMVREVRGRGLMIGIELRRRATPVLQALMERGVLALPGGKTVLRLLPPLIVGEQDLEKVRMAIADSLEKVYGRES